MSAPVLVFDIETVPDVEGGRRLYGFEDLQESDVELAMRTQRRAQRGSDFQPLHLQRVVAISCALRSQDELRIWSLGDESSSEAELIQRFFEGLERYRPTLVSWNGSGFDLPVLSFRALIHGVPAARFWDSGHIDRETKWDNYLARYQFRHTDLMDVLALYQARAFAPLHEIAVLLGLPGKLGMDGSQVAGAFFAGRIGEIRAYCETDVLNTYLVYLRFQRVRGLLSAQEYEAEVARAQTFLAQRSEAHWVSFRDAWRASAAA
jgi:predicted PolB exonuclease-like 3'-5' exonuclease